jgi:hypothetical protein
MSFEELLEELRKGYLASMPDKIANIERLWEARELQLLETEYHKLKGTGRTYGLPEVSQLGMALERLCEIAPHTLANAIPLSLKLMAWIQTERESGKSPSLESAAAFQEIQNILLAAERSQREQP